MLNAQYLERAFYPAYLASVEEFFCRAVAEVDFDTVVVTGTSGLIMGPHLARTHRKGLLVVRKPNDNSHSVSRLTGHHGKRLFLVDDVVETGETVSRVLRTVEEHWRYDEKPMWAGAFFWSQDTDAGRKLTRLSHSALRGAPVYSCIGYIRPVTHAVECWSTRVGAAGVDPLR